MGRCQELCCCSPWRLLMLAAISLALRTAVACCCDFFDSFSPRIWSRATEESPAGAGPGTAFCSFCSLPCGCHCCLDPSFAWQPLARDKPLSRIFQSSRFASRRCFSSCSFKCTTRSFSCKRVLRAATCNARPAFMVKSLNCPWRWFK